MCCKDIVRVVVLVFWFTLMFLTAQHIAGHLHFYLIRHLPKFSREEGGATGCTRL
jgi:hypothetical protein